MNHPKKTPKHCFHKASGLGYVRLNGKCHYTGRWGAEDALRRYDELLSTWLVNGRVLPTDPVSSAYRIRDLIADYLTFAADYYRKDGEPTKEVVNIRYAVKPLLDLYGNDSAVDFGPKRLKVYREVLIARDLCRTLINQRVGIIKRMFNWAASEEKVLGESAAALRSVAGLKYGRSRARETVPVTPVPEGDFEATTAQLGPEVAAMVRLQWLTAMRPGEVVQMRWADVDTSGAVWLYRPLRHKTQHHGRERVIPFGPKAQAILAHFRRLDPSAPIFVARLSGQQAEEGAYSTVTYRRAITRACRRACVDPWTPNRLRHSAATRIRRQYGLDAARALLGHSTPAVTEIYAELDMAQAERIMGDVG